MRIDVARGVEGGDACCSREAPRTVRMPLQRYLHRKQRRAPIVVDVDGRVRKRHAVVPLCNLHGIHLHGRAERVLLLPQRPCLSRAHVRAERVCGLAHLLRAYLARVSERLGRRCHARVRLAPAPALWRLQSGPSLLRGRVIARDEVSDERGDARRDGRHGHHGDLELVGAHDVVAATRQHLRLVLRRDELCEDLGPRRRVADGCHAQHRRLVVDDRRTAGAPATSRVQHEHGPRLRRRSPFEVSILKHRALQKRHAVAVDALRKDRLQLIAQRRLRHEHRADLLRRRAVHVVVQLLQERPHGLRVEAPHNEHVRRVLRREKDATVLGPPPDQLNEARRLLRDDGEREEDEHHHKDLAQLGRRIDVAVADCRDRHDDKVGRFEEGVRVAHLQRVAVLRQIQVVDNARLLALGLVLNDLEHPGGAKHDGHGRPHEPHDLPAHACIRQPHHAVHAQHPQQLEQPEDADDAQELDEAQEAELGAAARLGAVLLPRPLHEHRHDGESVHHREGLEDVHQLPLGGHKPQQVVGGKQESEDDVRHDHRVWHLRLVRGDDVEYAGDEGQHHLHHVQHLARDGGLHPHVQTRSPRRQILRNSWQRVVRPHARPIEVAETCSGPVKEEGGEVELGGVLVIRGCVGVLRSRCAAALMSLWVAPIPTAAATATDHQRRRAPLLQARHDRLGGRLPPHGARRHAAPGVGAAMHAGDRRDEPWRSDARGRADPPMRGLRRR
mmetsp:Transcript_7913/g.28088  ORF Transcript_7913/g.28088 Transcript_7913/m.28088 type:complete len:728 (+) Transcript_7913:2839-5022(+)